jgi:hypothetical protein
MELVSWSRADRGNPVTTTCADSKSGPLSFTSWLVKSATLVLPSYRTLSVTQSTRLSAVDDGSNASPMTVRSASPCNARSVEMDCLLANVPSALMVQRVM